ncbi:DUF934 domain-containing protein [Reyranella sp.]|jgi:uncharacterized protein (DUF934 family)|uniref:DUF934 domain-containing protein n=1 Tax=Reyranella sp. TaxID=1929291 RepID=UPI000BD42D25|nr:DUF934 domain-containing protein [Reyranella sp.]OYY42038.1 MAG: hypothetical protein B7Y57_12545 [Rhodospirillales bacterium 35-66-84]OYZ93819.1 MAG: hypothetical protein B7Y08_15190 [Rhodospirillales bacterium 24-66-33]OZB25069.1 MAG: hypothetical protein B7X63_13350 [Rhodospirillales bacterium 39-66-50]HQS17923.1 DUF934 domain-containing protein [Reyranella sp.]HQT10640.1 DUF934 domain-containing protein [Reyranella sp.]
MALYSEAGLPASYVALPFAQWKARSEWPAVSLANTDPIEDLAPHVGRLRLVVLDFPKFSDGRAYSQARLLRGRLGYRGELRATGGVLQDQIAFMLRCGFDSFESEQQGFGEALARARTLFSVVYQPAEDDQVPASLRRLGQANAAAS